MSEALGIPLGLVSITIMMLREGTEHAENRRSV
ncbi:hypothetical protein SAMN04515695_4426 [Pseudovibrio sp. Tun.PSC04-5.I4]|nr:hypothetical protein SAMN04515695_4426 [Pseudovibrio sp. Tun.PSC04-5.I4]